MESAESNSAAAGGKTQNNSVPPVEGVAGGGTSYGWVDGGLQGSSLGNGAIDPTKVHSADLLHVWSMPSTANVSQQEAPRQLEHVNLLAARNERESFQIALRPKVSWATSGIAGSVQVQCTDLCSSAGDRLVVGQSVTLRRVVPMLGVPDALVPIDPLNSQINLLPGETSAIWVSLNVPCGQQPGIYEGEIFITAVRTETESRGESLTKSERYQLYRELRSCLDITEHREYSSSEEMVQNLTSASTTLRRMLDLPSFQDCQESNGLGDMMDEDIMNNVAVRLKLSLTVWDFTLPLTPSLPAVFGIGFVWSMAPKVGMTHLIITSGGSFNTESVRFSADGEIACEFWHTRALGLAKEYYSDPRLAAYAVPYAPILSSTDSAKNSLRREVEILKSEAHWSKSYFYLWDEPLNVEQYHVIRSISNELQSYASDVRILTTYYCGPSGSELAPSTFEAFVKVPNEWWTYVCMGPSDPQPNWHLGMRGTQHRAVMWRVWKEGGTGFLYWGTNCYEKAMIPSAEICFRRGLPPGDGVLFYPGEVFSSSHEPVASTRLERVLSGMQDIEYLKLYSSKYGREEGLALLEKTGMYFGPDRYAHDHGPIDVMRGEVAIPEKEAAYNLQHKWKVIVMNP
uniref:Glycoside hydrolase 123 catalytic domain-containing protein n=1 Tax=Leersia perrieri TaxID=77586 RepID=A0A0D9X0T2_9ORYZ